MMETISFNRFKKSTHHKKVAYVWTSLTGVKNEFKTNKFYINRHGESYSMPYFLIGIENKFYQVDDTTFKAVSEYGETVFNIQEAA